MKGHVSTPDDLAKHMVKQLFNRKSPDDGDRVLFPGVGSRAPFIRAVQHWCDNHDYHIPDGVGIELDPDRIEDAREHVDDRVDLLERDFLDADLPDDFGGFEYIVGNPPYVPIEKLSEDEKQKYKSRFEVAQERFDLYLLFYERSLQMLAKNGRLVFVTPEKYEYVGTAEPLRRLLTSNYHLRRIEHHSEDAFGDYITYPCVSVVDRSSPGPTQIRRRDGSGETVQLPENGDSWASAVRLSNGPTPDDTGVTLGDVTERVSPGIATGRDGIFVMSYEDCPPQLIEEGWTYPTVSGRQLETYETDAPDVMVCPYMEDGSLALEDELGAFGEWAEMHRDEFESRSCVSNGTPWYGFHENPPLDDILQPKILLKDVADEPQFWIDSDGDILPRHTVYYIIPDGIPIEEMTQYLNSPEVSNWLCANCQKAHNDYFRLQSSVLRELPVPRVWGDTVQQTLI